MSLEDKSCQNYNLTGDANKLFNLDVLRAKIQLSKENPQSIQLPLNEARVRFETVKKHQDINDQHKQLDLEMTGGEPSYNI